MAVVARSGSDAMAQAVGEGERSHVVGPRAGAGRTGADDRSRGASGAERLRAGRGYGRRQGRRGTRRASPRRELGADRLGLLG